MRFRWQPHNGACSCRLFNYDANDRFTAGDTYDNNDNTISSGGIANVGVYPERSRGNFENHLIQKDGVTMTYDGDGNRATKTVAGLTTANPTAPLHATAAIASGINKPFGIYISGFPFAR